MPQKLLLADDSVTIQRVIELTFADENIEVIAVGNGQQAIERAERDKPDIVLADVGMPERDGYEVAAFIKGNPALSHIPVVLLTGAFEPIDETRARAVGCDGVLVKPFEPQMVISRVKDLLAGQRPPASASWNAASEQTSKRAPAGQSAAAPGPASPAATPGPASGDPLEAYFDRLDAAFASMESGGTGASPAPKRADTAPSAASHPVRRDPIPLSREAQPAPAPFDGLGSWDPDLEGDVSRTPQAVSQTPMPSPTSEAPQASRPAEAAAPPHVEAAAPAQQAEAAAPAPPVAAASSAPAATAPAPSLVEAFAALLAAEQQVGIAPSLAPRLDRAANDEQLVEAVTQRVLSRLTDQARPTILDVAERLVRDEIDRIKRNR